MPSMWVTPGSRKEGIALLLAEAVFEWAKEDGADTVTLYVGPDNTGARAVYDSLGFEDTGDRWVVVEDRSEERRVGKECKSGWSPYHEREKRGIILENSR